MPTRKLLLLAGLPRSGKSTWAREQRLPIVCPDAVRLAIHGMRFLTVAEPWVWLLTFTMVQALFLAGNEVIIIDATNTTQRRRSEWAAKFPGVEIELKVFETSPKICKERAFLTGQQDLVEVIDRMAANWDLPKPKEWEET